MFKISVFKGFTRETGKTEVLHPLQEIIDGKHFALVEKIRKHIEQGNKEKASHIKKQLPAVTFSATYQGRRVPEQIQQYNDVLILDVDGLNQEQIELCRMLIVQQPCTLFLFTSPSGNGLKAGVYLTDEEACRWRNAIFTKESITYNELEHYHKRMFEKAKALFELLCGLTVDPSGSDIGRLCFLSFDPAAYINRQALEEVVIPAVNITTTPPPAKKKGAGKVFREEMPGNTNIDCSQIDTPIQMMFQKCVNSVRRTFDYKPGQRDTFIYTLASTCYARSLPQDAVALLAEKHFGAPDLDVQKIVGNAYHYTSKIDRAEEEKKKNQVQRIVEFMDQHYRMRRNTVLERLEIEEKLSGLATTRQFVAMKRKHYNTVFLDLQLAGINCHPSIVRSVIDSRYVEDFDPFVHYFGTLPPWDGTTDYIARLADTVETTTQDFWRDCLKRWLVGLVACALDVDIANQLALIVKGAQGKGKSTWIRNLLPPQLKEYYRNGMPLSTNRDHMLCMSQRLIINLEEFEGMKNGDIAELKRLITQDSITERKVYDYDIELFNRRASFIASTNEPRFLEDITGTRRFPTVTALKIDYKTPVDHQGIYSQAMYLWKNNFRYWYEESEIDRLNEQNSQYSLQSAEEELFYLYFRKPGARDIEQKWMPVTAILSYLSHMGKILVNNVNSRKLLKVFDRDGFNKRKNDNNIWEYEVIQLTVEEINRNYKKQISN